MDYNETTGYRIDSMYMENKLAVQFGDDGGVAFFYKSDPPATGCHVCYPIAGTTAQELLTDLEPLLWANGWITPVDAQEIACKNRLATYSRR